MENIQRENIFNFNLVLNSVKELAFDTLFYNMPNTFYWLDKDGYCLGCNQEELSLLGFDSLDQFVGKHASEIFEKQAWLNSEEVIKNKTVQQFEEMCPLNNGSKKYFLTIKAPIFDNVTNEVVGLIGFSIDITAQKQAEIAKQEFIENMEHDIRTPFSGIFGIANILQSMETDPNKKEFISHITESTRRLIALTNEFLDVSAMGSKAMQFTHFSLKDCLTDIYHLMLPEAISKGIELTVEDTNIEVYLDKGRLSRLLLNLVGNAIKFTKSGKVSIKISNTDKLKISVEDTGIGIPADKLDIIFDRFTKLTPSNWSSEFLGVGVGLSIVKQYAADLGGEITVTSEVDKGSCFTFSV